MSLLSGHLLLLLRSPRVSNFVVYIVCLLDLDRHLTHLIIISLHFYTDNVKQGSPASTKTVTLFVKPQAGKSHKIEISANSTVDQVKDAIEDLEAIPTSEQRLIFSGKEPEGETTLSQLGISDWSTAELIVRGVAGVVDNPYARKVQPAKKGRTYVSPGRRGGQGDRVVNGGQVVGRGAGRMSTPLLGHGRGGRADVGRGSGVGRAGRGLARGGWGGRVANSGRVSSQQARGTGRGHVTPPFQGRQGSNVIGRGRGVNGRVGQGGQLPQQARGGRDGGGLSQKVQGGWLSAGLKPTPQQQEQKMAAQRKPPLVSDLPANPYPSNIRPSNPYDRKTPTVNPYTSKITPVNQPSSGPVNPYQRSFPPPNPYAPKVPNTSTPLVPAESFIETPKRRKV